MNRLLPINSRLRIRRQFPQLAKTIFFNAASLGPWPENARQALEDQLDEWNSLIDPTPKVFDFWRATQKELATMIGTSPARIGFAFNTSHGLAIAAAGLGLKPGEEIILSNVEFPANTYPWTNLESKGIRVKFIKSRKRCFEIEAFLKAITSKTKVLSLSFVQFFNGFRNDLKTLGEICNENGIFFVVDGTQGVGNIPIDVRECRIDLLACGAQKWLLSPVGSGFFYLSKNPKIEIAPNLAGWFGVDWHQDWSNLLRHHLKPRKTAERHSLSAVPYLQIYAMHSSIKLINSVGVAKICSHNLALLDILINYLQDHKFYHLTSNTYPQNRSSILTFNCPETRRLHQYLTTKKIITSFRENSIRISVHFYNLPEEIEQLISQLEHFAKKTKTRV